MPTNTASATAKDTATTTNSTQNMNMAYSMSYTALEKLNEALKAAKPEQLYDLTEAVKNIVGSATIFDLLNHAQHERTQLSTLNSQQIKQLNQLSTDYLKQIKDEADSQDDRVQKAGTRELNNLQEATTDQLKALDDTAKKQRADLEKLGENKLTPQQLGILPNSRPFLFGVAERYEGNGGITYTSEFGQFYSGKGSLLCDMITGLNSDKRLNRWERPPQLNFIQGDTWHFAEQKPRYAQSSNNYNYPIFMVAMVLVKNTTDKAIVRAFGRRYTSRWSSGYEGASLNVGTPDAAKTKITWNTVGNYTGSTGDRGDSINITIPANTTVAVVSYNSAHYITSSNDYQFYRRLMLEKMNSFFGRGLEIDIEATLIAAQKVKTNQKEIWGIK